jgi:hypothetical protein
MKQGIGSLRGLVGDFEISPHWRIVTCSDLQPLSDHSKHGCEGKSLAGSEYVYVCSNVCGLLNVFANDIMMVNDVFLYHIIKLN